MIRMRRGAGKWILLGVIAGPLAIELAFPVKTSATVDAGTAAGAWVTHQLDQDARDNPGRRDAALNRCVFPDRRGKLDWITIQRCYARLMPIQVAQGGCPTGAPPFCWTDPKTLVMHCTCGGPGTRAGR